MTDDIRSYYDLGAEGARLEAGPGRLERERTERVLALVLPPPPAVVLDVGGGTGPYARWLAGRGYEVHLVDPVPLHLEQARAVATPALASIREGDARDLDRPDASADAVLLLGPLYHLVAREDRVRALAEAARVLRPGGVVVAAAISRFASLFAGLAEGLLDDPAFRAILDRDLREGQHRNPTGNPEYFTTAYFHRPEELEEEVAAASLRLDRMVAVEGPAWLAPDLEARWQDPARRAVLLSLVERIESEPTLLAVSAHLLAIARKA